MEGKNSRKGRSREMEKQREVEKQGYELNKTNWMK